jgi:hypothetical protein
MKKFSTYLAEGFLAEEGERPAMSAGGREAERHVKQYVTPYLPGGELHGKGTHTLATDHGNLKAGTKITLHAHTLQTSGSGKVSHSVEASIPGSKQKHNIPLSKIRKPGEAPKNEGHKFETDFINHVKKHGIMPQEAQGAGSTAGTDFVIENKKKKTMHSGTVNSEENIFHGETKQDTRAAFGQLTIHHSSEKGWHIGDKARSQRPGYAKAIEEAGILDHMNKHHNPDKHEIQTTPSGRAKNVVVTHPNLDPAEAYLRDHHVHVLHVGGGYGTYHVGEEDQTGHGFPSISGHGKWTVREKQAGNKRARTVMFQPNGVTGLTKSHINLEDEKHIAAFKKTLGHTK